VTQEHEKGGTAGQDIAQWAMGHTGAADVEFEQIGSNTSIHVARSTLQRHALDGRCLALRSYLTDRIQPGRPIRTKSSR
jgi:hypothetical protein